MSSYTLNCLSNGRVFRCEEFNAENDMQAIEQAIELKGIAAAELWTGDRLVHRFAQLAHHFPSHHPERT